MRITNPAGYRHDGTLTGRLRSELISGRIARRPFRQQTTVGLDYGTELDTATSAFQRTQIWDNPDGSGTGVSISVAPGINHGARVWWKSFGPLAGMYWRQDNISTLTPVMSVKIDGANEQHADARDLVMLNEGLTSAVSVGYWVFDRDLDPDVEHHIELTVPADVSTGTTRTLVVYGRLVDGWSTGDSDPVPVLHPGAATMTLLGNTFSTVLSGSSPLATLRAIQYFNGSGSDVPVTLAYGGLTSSDYYDSITVPASGGKTYTLPDAFACGTSLSHMAGSANAVRYVLLGKV